ncbi:hypothetical protein Tco_1032265 [Tanacetum coccineum]|uniref:Uncharacterized protein n=1 Tax=Tanacetum coccineum TaxID=301880 RepID=A0ABQ5GD13_9ASTR
MKGGEIRKGGIKEWGGKGNRQKGGDEDNKETEIRKGDAEGEDKNKKGKKVEKGEEKEIYRILTQTGGYKLSRIIEMGKEAKMR